MNPEVRVANPRQEPTINSFMEPAGWGSFLPPTVEVRLKELAGEVGHSSCLFTQQLKPHLHRLFLLLSLNARSHC